MVQARRAVRVLQARLQDNARYAFRSTSFFVRSISHKYRDVAAIVSERRGERAVTQEAFGPRFFKAFAFGHAITAKTLSRKSQSVDGDCSRNQLQGNRMA